MCHFAVLEGKIKLCSNAAVGLWNHSSVIIKQMKCSGVLLLLHSDQCLVQRHSSLFWPKWSAALNEPLSCYWTEFVLFGPLSCAARRKPASPCAHSTCIDTHSLMSWTPLELGNGFTPLDAAVSTSADTAHNPSLQFFDQAVGLPAVCNYSFSRILDIRVGWLAFLCFSSLVWRTQWLASLRHPQLWRVWA